MHANIPKAYDDIYRAKCGHDCACTCVFFFFFRFSQNCYVLERERKESVISHGCRVVRMVKVLITNSKPVRFKLDGSAPLEGRCSLKVER